MSNMWLYHMGPQWAKYMMMTGDTIDGEMAEKIGFAIKSVPEDKLESTVMHVAERLANVRKECCQLIRGCEPGPGTYGAWLHYRGIAVNSDSITTSRTLCVKYLTGPSD